jgi:multiple sugar transport system substrate-binding protein
MKRDSILRQSGRQPGPWGVRRGPVGYLPVVVLILSLIGCGQRDPSESSLVFAVGGAAAELAVWEQVAKNFEAQSGIRVNLLRQPANSQQQLQGLMVALKAEQENPDLFLMDVAWMGLFNAAGWLEPLEGLDEDIFFGELLYQNGKLMAAPVYIDGGILYYRKDLLETAGLAGPPGTWGELVQSARRVQAVMRRENPDFFGFVWQGAQYEGLVVNFLEFAGKGAGIVLESEKGRARVRVNLPRNVEALRFMRDLIWEDKISPPNTYTAMREEEVRRAFQSGNAMYARNWPYAWSLHQQAHSPVKDKVGIAPLPHPPDGRTLSTLGGYHIGISRFSNQKDAARAFVAYVTSQEAQRMVVVALGWNPGRSDLYEDESILRRYPHFRQFKEIFRDSRPRPMIAHYSQISNVLQTYISGTLARRFTAEQAFERAQKEIDSIEARYDQGRQKERR